MQAVVVARQVHVCAYCSHLVVDWVDHYSIIVSNKSYRAKILTIQGMFGLRTCPKLNAVVTGRMLLLSECSK